jgi:hypothetical protein
MREQPAPTTLEDDELEPAFGRWLGLINRGG